MLESCPSKITCSLAYGNKPEPFQHLVPVDWSGRYNAVVTAQPDYCRKVVVKRLERYIIEDSQNSEIYLAVLINLSGAALRPLQMRNVVTLQHTIFVASDMAPLRGLSQVCRFLQQQVSVISVSFCDKNLSYATGFMSDLPKTVVPKRYNC
jgi:hypothetical protein